MVLVAVVVCAVALLGLTRVGDAAVRRARVDAIADLSALAAVVGGRTAAEDVATASGAAVSGFEQLDDLSIEVEVGFEGITGRAGAAARGEVLSGTEVGSDPDPLTGRR